MSEIVDKLNSIESNVSSKYNNPNLINSISFNNKTMGKLLTIMSQSVHTQKIFAYAMSLCGIYSKPELIKHIQQSRFIKNTKTTRHTLALIHHNSSLFFLSRNRKLNTIPHSSYFDNFKVLESKDLKSFIVTLIKNSKTLN